MPLPTVARPAPPVAPLCAAVLAALSLGCLQAALLALPNLNLDNPVATSAPVGGDAVTPRRRVLLVVIDGLRADLAEGLPFLKTLGERGAWIDLAAELPTYSSPQYVALLTGVPPRDSGVRTNTPLRVTPLDSVVRRVTASGRVAIQIGDEVDWWTQIFGPDFTSTGVVAPGRLLAEAGRAMAGADLAIVHICGVDRAGHDHGGSSAAYQAAAREADDETRLLAAAWGWPEATVVVMADHGHVDAGGHGGEEADVQRTWLAAGGAGIRAGIRSDARTGARMIDVAPTLAALLGVAAPADAQGRTLVEALDVDEPAARALTAEDTSRIARATLAAATGRRALRDAAADRQFLRLLGLATGLALVLIILRRAGRPAWFGLLVGLATLVTTAAVWAVWYERLSFSADRDTAHLAVGTGFLACGATLLAFAPAFSAALRGRLKPTAACALSIGAVLGASPVAMFVFVYAGAFQKRIDCAPGWSAALPLVTYCAFVPPVFAAALLISTASTRAMISNGRS